MNDEKKLNGQVKWLALAAVLIVITVMYSNLYICTRMMDTVDKLTAAYPRVYIARDRVMDELEVIEEKEEAIAEEVQQIEIVEEKVEEEIKEPGEGVLTKQRGTVTFDGHKETYYNLPMKKVCENATKKGIEGEYWEREDGTKMFGDYIIVAADQKIHPYGSLVETSLGTGIVLDTGEFIKSNPQQIDIAVNW